MNNHQFVVAIAFMVVGGLLPVLYLLIVELPLRSLLIPIAFMTIGIGLLSWWVLALILAFFGGFGLWLYASILRDKSYKRKFPVFETKPFRTVVSRNGFERRLHIARIPAGFIIGIDYDHEVDQSPMTLQTRWTSIYPDYETAENALLSLGKR